MEEIMLYRFVIVDKKHKYTDIDAIKYILMSMSEFEKEDMFTLIECISDIQKKYPYPDYSSNALTKTWWTAKGYDDVVWNYGVLKKVLKKYDKKVTLCIQCINPDDKSIVYNDGYQLVAFDRDLFYV